MAQPRIQKIFLGGAGIVMLAFISFFGFSEGTVEAAPKPDFQVDEVVWKAWAQAVTIRGSVASGSERPQLNVADSTTGQTYSAVLDWTPRATRNRWRATISSPSPVPCSVNLSMQGFGEEVVAVNKAPADCSNGGGGGGDATASLTLDSAAWDPNTQTLLVLGTGFLAPGERDIMVLDADSNGPIAGNLTFPNSPSGSTPSLLTWRFEATNLVNAPCSVSATTAGGSINSDLLAVDGAPDTCGPVVGENSPPTCEIVQPTEATIEIEQFNGVYFEGTGSDPDGDPLDFTWDFGGGAPSSSVNEPGLVSFGTPGIFSVQMTVSDGQATCESPIITVQVAPADLQLPPSVAEQSFIQGNEVQVFANNDLGMHCSDLGTAPFSVLPPFNNLNAQLVRRAVMPEVLGPGTSGIELRYSAVSNPNDPVGPGSINSTSSNWPVGSNSDVAIVRKSDFWDDLGGISYPEIIFGLSLETDQGLIFNQYMPGAADPYVANDPQPFGVNEHLDVFAALGIPMTPVDDAGQYNPYPLFRVQAIDTATGDVLSTVDAVVPVSTELNCQACHLPGQVAADPDARPADLGFVFPTDPNDRLSVETAAKFNALFVHDYRHGDAYDPPLASRQTVLCASCHNSPALSEVGGPAGDPERVQLSLVVHGFHGKLTVDSTTGELIRDAAGEPVLPVELQAGQERLIPIDINDPNVPLEDNCFECHPGKQTQCFRGVMRTAGLKCANCHGDLLAIGGEFPLRPVNVASVDDAVAAHDGIRRPWADLPRCESCHTGQPEVMRVAYETDDPAATARRSDDKRYAENVGTLYRNSRGHGDLLCETCHGSPHAIWPLANENANDNVAAIQIQGHSGAIGECTVCHTDIPKQELDQGVTLDGPHGMHPVANANFNQKHKALWERNPNACRTCHGQNLQGTRLSETFTERTLRTKDDGGPINVAKGTQISCTLCHERPD